MHPIARRSPRPGSPCGRSSSDVVPPRATETIAEIEPRRPARRENPTHFVENIGEPCHIALDSGLHSELSLNAIVTQSP